MTEQKRGFIHLHNHTEYSLLDGAAPVGRLIDTAKKLNCPAIAMTDHGNMYGAIKFYLKCKEVGIKPIIGCEFYVAEDLKIKQGKMGDENNKFEHLVLLAKNHQGFLNLAKLNSIAFIDGHYYRPRVDLPTLQQYSSGLICLSACIGGSIPRLILKNDEVGAEKYARKLQEIYGKEDFYIELQNHDLTEEKYCNPKLVALAKKIGAKVVATNDCHYIEKEDDEMHDVLLCIGTGRFIDEPNRMRFENNKFYFKTYEEMAKLFDWCPEAVETPYEIADKIDLQIKFNEYKIPVFQWTDGLSPEEYLRKMAYDGIIKRYGDSTPLLKERADNELEVINSMGFAQYYLIVWDFIRYAKDNDIPVGAGRGSGVGSLVAYCVGITDVDPIKYDLIFERFLNKDRMSMPDFDVDFCFDRRGEVIDYVKSRYGADHTSQIITFGKLKKKASIKDVARVFRVPFADVTKITKLIVDDGCMLRHMLGIFTNDKDREKYASAVSQEFIDLYHSSPLYEKIISIAMKIENMPRNTSVHAAGVVIYPNVASDMMPLARNGEEITTQFDMKEVEKLGFLKMDFLALKTLTDVKMAHDYVKDQLNLDVDFKKLGYDDRNVYNFIADGKTDAVFQLESGGMKDFMQRLQPYSFEEIIAGISLYRPGPMDEIKGFIFNKFNPEKIDFGHELLRPILSVTFGVIVYQEQAMRITTSLAGYSLSQADNFRGIISKKLVDKMDEEEKKFVYGGEDKKGHIRGCVNNGIAEQFAIDLFAKMRKFGSYAFNKSHAAAYAVLSYETAFYMLYYPLYFLSAVLNNRISNPDDTSKYMQVLDKMNIKLLQPDINSSMPLFAPFGDNVRYGLACIKNVGFTAMTAVCKERDTHGKFKNLSDFFNRVGNLLNKKMIESLIYGGGFDCFGLSRRTLINNYDKVFIAEMEKRERASSLQTSFFDVIEEGEADFKYEIVDEFPTREKLKLEKEVLKMYVSGHPLTGYESEFKAFNIDSARFNQKNDDDDEDGIESEDDQDVDTVSSIEYTNGMEIFGGGLVVDFMHKKTKQGDSFGIIVVEDLYGTLEFTVFNRAYNAIKDTVNKDDLIKFKGKISVRDDKTRIMISYVSPWIVPEKLENAQNKGHTYYLHQEDDNSSVSMSSTATISSSKILYLNFPIAERYNEKLLTSILAKLPGQNIVRVQIEKRVFQHSLKVENYHELLPELTKLVGGVQNIKII